MCRTRDANALTPWLESARGTELQAFVTGVERDRDAVLAALCFRWSTSQVEGQVQRLKVMKRSMYGRAKFDLLRKRCCTPPDRRRRVQAPAGRHHQDPRRANLRCRLTAASAQSPNDTGVGLAPPETLALWVDLVAKMGPDDLADFAGGTFRQGDRASLGGVRRAIERRRRELGE